MKVVGHQAVRVHLKIRLETRFGHCFEEILSIDFIEENVFAPISSAHHMVNRSRILNADFSWHGLTTTGKSINVSMV